MKTLLIVNVQKIYGHWFSLSYLNKLKSFIQKEANQYDRVFTIITPSGELTPYADHVPTFITEHLTCEPYYMNFSTDFWTGQEIMNCKQEYWNVLPSSSPIKPTYEVYYNQEFRTLLDMLKQSDHVHVVGGGRYKNVDIAAKILDRHNIENQILDAYCYDMRFVVDTNWKDTNTFDYKSNRFKLTEIPLVFNP